MSMPKRVEGFKSTNTYRTERKIRVYVTGTGSALDPLVVDTGDTTYSIGNSYKSWATTDGNAALAGPIAAEAWTAAGLIEAWAGGVVTSVPCEAGVAIGDELILSDTTDARLDTKQEVYSTVIAGGSAGDHTVTGINTGDTLVAVLHLDMGGNAETDLTSQFTISAADTINNAAGTDTSSDTLIVTYRRHGRRVGVALTAAATNTCTVALDSYLDT